LEYFDEEEVDNESLFSDYDGSSDYSDEYDEDTYQVETDTHLIDHDVPTNSANPFQVLTLRRRQSNIRKRLRQLDSDPTSYYEEAIPVYYEEDYDDDTDPNLLNDYVLIDLNGIIFPLPEGDLDPTSQESTISNPSYQATIQAAWWEGWKNSAFLLYLSEPSEKPINSLPSHQVAIQAAWWEGWKVSRTPQLFSPRSLLILIYLFFVYFMFAKSMIYSVPPICNTSISCDLIPYQLALTSPCLMGRCVMSYTNVPTGPPWSYLLDPTISATRIQQRTILSSLLRTFLYRSSDRPSAQLLQQGMVWTVEDPVLIFDPG
jgi:hypothetical protein